MSRKEQEEVEEEEYFSQVNLLFVCYVEQFIYC